MFKLSAEAASLRSAQARAAALQGAAMRDNKAQGQLGHRGLQAKFYAQIDAKFPDISPAERERRMRMLLKAQMIRVRSERTRKDFRRKAAAGAN